MHNGKKFIGFLTQKIKANKNKIFIALFLLLFSLISASMIFKPGFPVTDDGTWLIIRFSAFFETLRSGQFPVRFIYRLNDGMGYPVSNFLYPLYLYLATLIHIIGFNFINSIKLLLIINVFLSAVFSFLWLSKRFNNISSLIGSAALVLSPYYLFDIYKRGSIGELLTFSIVPFILWQIERRSFILLSLGFFLLILSHNTLGFLFLIFIIFYASVYRFNLKLVCKSLLLGIGLSAFFWIPALYDLSATVFLSTKVSNFYDYLFKFNDLHLLGLSTLFILIGSILIIFKKKKMRKDLFLVSTILISIIIILLQLPQGKFFWEFFPFKDFIQFPFRLLSILTIIVTFHAAFITNSLKKPNNIIFSGILIVILFFQTFFILNKVEIQKFEEGFYSTNQSTTTVSNEYLSKWFKNSDSHWEKILIISGRGKINSVDNRPGKINFSSNFETEGEIQINYAYFPAWKVVVDGKEREINYTKNGLISFAVNKGINNISIIYEQSKLHKISNLISVASFIVLLFFIVKSLNVNSLSYNFKRSLKKIKK